MVLEGVDPYENAPESSRFQHLYDEGFYVAPEHRSYSTIYPPLALSVFTLCAQAGAQAGFWIWKTLITAASVLGLWLVAVVLREKERAGWLVWLALSPLAVFEVGVGAHVDALAMLGVSILVWGMHRSKQWWSSIGLAVAILSKIIPAWLLLAGLIRRSLRKSFIGAVALTLIAYGLAMALGFKPLGSLFEFAEVWRFGSVFGFSSDRF